MSTRVVIYSNEETGVNIYYEMLEGVVKVEMQDDGLDFDFRLMSIPEWEQLIKDMKKKGQK